MQREKYQEIFDYISSEKPNGVGKSSKWKQYPKWADKESVRRNFRETSSHYEICKQDGLLYRKADKQHPARPVLLLDDASNQLTNAHGSTHRGINEMWVKKFLLTCVLIQA